MIENKKKNAINDHRVHLEKLRNAFHAECARIGDEVNDKVKGLDLGDQEGLAEIYNEQQRKMDQILAELNNEITKANHYFLSTLEKISHQEEDVEIKKLAHQIST